MRRAQTLPAAEPGRRFHPRKLSHFHGRAGCLPSETRSTTSHEILSILAEHFLVSVEDEGFGGYVACSYLCQFLFPSRAQQNNCKEHEDHVRRLAYRHNPSTAALRDPCSSFFKERQVWEPQTSSLKNQHAGVHNTTPRSLPYAETILVSGPGLSPAHCINPGRSHLAFHFPSRYLSHTAPTTTLWPTRSFLFSILIINATWC